MTSQTLLTNLLDDITNIPALTVRQPWASFIVRGRKLVEVRSWAPGHRGWVWVHAGSFRPPARSRLMRVALAEAGELDYSAIVGRVRVVEIVKLVEVWDSLDRWQRMVCGGERRRAHLAALWAWMLSDAVPCPPVWCDGALGLWWPSPRLRSMLRERCR